MNKIKMDDDGIPNKRQRLEKSISDNSFGNDDSSSKESSSHVDHDDDDDDEWSDSSFDKSDDFEEEIEDEDSDIVSESDLNKSSSFNDKSLHTAVKENNLKLLEKILKEGVDIDAPDENSNTALHIAVKKQNILFVRHLLKYGADITTRTNYSYRKNYTPLHLAAELKRTDIAKDLLTVKPDFTTTKTIRNKLFQFALWRKNFKLMNYLNGDVAFSSKCTRKIRTTQSFISLGAMGYSPDMIKLMLGDQSDINLITDEGETALLIAVRNGDVDMLKLLLKNGASPRVPGFFKSYKWYSGFHLAAEMNRVDMMKVFMDHHFDKDDATEEGITALHIAVINKNVDLVKTLLSWNANVNVKAMYCRLVGYTPLHMAVVENSLEIIKLLLDTKGIDVRATNGNRETALHIAARKEYLDIIEYLLKFDIDINAKSGLLSQISYTPLHIAAEKKNNDIINILLAHGADINAVTAIGEYAIHVAVHARDLSVIQNFLSHGVDIDLKTIAGNSPLHIAVSEEHVRIVVYLLSKGANIDLRTRRGSCALDIAIDCNHLELTRILLNAGADINFLLKNRDEFSETCNTLKRHVIKLITANVMLKNSSLISSWFSYGKKMEKYRSKCAKEVELLKKSKIGSSNISYYDILIKDIDQLARCAKNIDIIETLVPGNVINKFPLYGYLVMSRFIKGISRRDMIKKVEPLLLDVLYELPPIVVGIIIDYLSDEDLKTISTSL